MDDTITATRAAMALLDPAVAAPMLADNFPVDGLSKKEMRRHIADDVMFADYVDMLFALDFDEKQDLVDVALQTVADRPSAPGFIPRFLSSRLSRQDFCRLAAAVQLSQPGEETKLWRNYKKAWALHRMDQHLDLLDHDQAPDSGYETPPRPQPLHAQTVAQLPIVSTTQPSLASAPAPAPALVPVQVQPTVQPPPRQSILAESVSSPAEDVNAPEMGPSAQPSITVSSQLSDDRERRREKGRQKRKKPQEEAVAANRSKSGNIVPLEKDTRESRKQERLRSKRSRRKSRQSPQAFNITADNDNANSNSVSKKEKKRRKRPVSQRKLAKAQRELAQQPVPHDETKQSKPAITSSPAPHEIIEYGALPEASAATNKSVKLYDAPSTPPDLEHQTPSRSPSSLKASRIAAQSSPQHESPIPPIQRNSVDATDDRTQAHESAPHSEISPTMPAVEQPASSAVEPLARHPRLPNPAEFGPLGDPRSVSLQIPRAPNNPANIIQAQIDEMERGFGSDSDSSSDSSDDEPDKRTVVKKTDPGDRIPSPTNKSISTLSAKPIGPSGQEPGKNEDVRAESDTKSRPPVAAIIPPIDTVAAPRDRGTKLTSQIVKAALRDDYGFEGVAESGNETPVPIESELEDDLETSISEPLAEQHDLQPRSSIVEDDEISLHSSHASYAIEPTTRPESKDLPACPSYELPSSNAKSNKQTVPDVDSDHDLGHSILTDNSDAYQLQASQQLFGELKSSERNQSHTGRPVKVSSPQRSSSPVVIVQRTPENRRRQLDAEFPRAEPVESTGNEAVSESEHGDDVDDHQSAENDDSSPLSELDQTPSPFPWSKDAEGSPDDEPSPREDKPKPRKRKRKSTGTTSDHFEEPSPKKKKRRVPAGVSTAAFPPISTKKFGLIQEELWAQPFRLLVAVTFLNKTAGRSAVPVYRQLMEKYPTPADLAEADFDEVCAMVQHLGLQKGRAKKLIRLAQDWIRDPPRKGRLHRTMHYPIHGNGTQYRPSTIVEEDVEKCEGILEVGHFYGSGPYAWDSWRIFCRDVLRGVATDYNGEGATEPDFEPEWKRVLPNDKELRACLRWMWLREGYIWNPLTGEKTDADHEIMQKAAIGMTEWPIPEQKKDASLAEEGVTSQDADRTVEDLEDTVHGEDGGHDATQVDEDSLQQDTADRESVADGSIEKGSVEPEVKSTQDQYDSDGHSEYQDDDRDPLSDGEEVSEDEEDGVMVDAEKTPHRREASEDLF